MKELKFKTIASPDHKIFYNLFAGRFHRVDRPFLLEDNTDATYVFDKLDKDFYHDFATLPNWELVSVTIQFES